MKLLTRDLLFSMSQLKLELIIVRLVTKRTLVEGKKWPSECNTQVDAHMVHHRFNPGHFSYYSTNPVVSGYICSG